MASLSMAILYVPVLYFAAMARSNADWVSTICFSGPVRMAIFVPPTVQNSMGSGVHPLWFRFYKFYKNF